MMISALEKNNGEETETETERGSTEAKQKLGRPRSWCPPPSPPPSLPLPASGGQWWVWGVIGSRLNPSQATERGPAFS